MPQQQMSPIDRYRYDIEHNGFSEDAAQLNAVEHLQRLYEELIAWNNYQQLPALKRWLSKAPVKPKGLYFWGGVGRGKTYLVDIASQDNRALYVALSNTLTGVLMLVVGGIIGALAQWLGSAMLLVVLALTAVGAMFSAQRLPEAE